MAKRYFQVCAAVVVMSSAWVCGPVNAQGQEPRGAARADSPDASRVRRESEVNGRSGRERADLPDDHGQVWRQYDIRPYTQRLPNDQRPEQPIIDWILRETGTDVWFHEPVGLLSANRDTVSVYHTPEVQTLVSDVIDRFVKAESNAHVLTVRLVTVESPNWRVKVLPLLRPVHVRAQGVEAWLLSKEDAAIVLNELRKRTDYREHNSPNLLVHNGQSATISRFQPRTYARSVRFNGGVWPGYELETGKVQEGFSLTITPLLTLDAKTIDLVAECQVDQIEKMTSLWLDVPSPLAPRQRVPIHVPQMSSWRLEERFRWPADEVLLISRGMVAMPGIRSQWVQGLPQLIADGPARVDALLFLEHNRPVDIPVAERSVETRMGLLKYRGRY